MESVRSDKIKDELQAMAEELCFIKGFGVATDLLINVNGLGDKGLSNKHIINELLGGRA